MTTRAETIANHLRQIRMLPESDVRCLHLAFLETLGGAECASHASAAKGGLRAYKPECDSGDCILPRGHAEDHWDGHGAWPRVSPAAEGPWVVRVVHHRYGPGWDGGSQVYAWVPTLAEAARFLSVAKAEHEASEWSVSTATVLPLAEAEQAEKEQAALDRLPAHTKAVLAELDEEPSAEVIAMDDSPDNADPSVVPAEVRERGWQWRPVGDDGAHAPPFGTIRKCLGCGALVAGGTTRCVRCVQAMPAMEGAEDLSATLRREECERKAARQAKPAGWVVRLSNGQLRWLWMRTVAGAEYEPYATREDAQRIADTTGGEAVPVDAAGNVIEAADRNETMWLEAERVLRRLVATTTMERDEVRAELAAVKAERDELEADRDKWAANAGTLNRSLRQVHTESDALRADLDAALAERDRLAATEEALTYEARTQRECADQIIADMADLRAERDRLAAEVQWQVRPAHIAVSTNGSSVEAEHVPSGVRVLGGSRSEVLYRVQEERATRAEAERDRLAAEVQRGREQDPAAWCVWSGPDAVSVHGTKDAAVASLDGLIPALRARLTIAPLYLAPVVRDHSEVIAQCEEALREWDRNGAHCHATSSLVAITLTKARNALRGAP